MNKATSLGFILGLSADYSTQRTIFLVEQSYSKRCHVAEERSRLLISWKDQAGLLRLQPRLRYYFRAQFAQQTIDLIYHRFRLRGLDIELEHASR